MQIDKIHAEFHSLLYQYITARVKDKDDAADVLQEVFIKISSKLDSLADGSKLKSWIFTITSNAIIDYYRKNSGRNKTEQATAKPTAIDIQRRINEIVRLENPMLTRRIPSMISQFE